MKSLIEFLGCGTVFKLDQDACEYRVTKFSDIKDKIIPVFDKYPILGIKSEDFQDWCKVAEMMNKKEHLTEEGLSKIIKIKAGMNIGR